MHTIIQRKKEHGKDKKKQSYVRQDPESRCGVIFMAAIRATKRNKTAKDLAKKLGVHERTVRRYIALPRSDYESEAESRRKKAYNLHFKDGLKWRDVAEKMNTTEHAVKALAKRYKQIDQDARG